MILGRLEMLRKHKTRKEGNDKCRYCKEPIITGESYLVVKKTFDKIWTTKRFHIPCFPNWLEYMQNYIEVREKRRHEERKPTGRHRTVLTAINLTPELFTRRTKMMKRVSYLTNRFYPLRSEYRNAQTDWERGKLRTKLEKIQAEIGDLTTKINSIAPYTPFDTQKRIMRAAGIFRFPTQNPPPEEPKTEI